MGGRIWLFCCAVLAAPWALGQSVLFDQGHGQRFVVERDGPLELSQLADTFRQAGWSVRTTTSSLTTAQLDQVDALVISGSFAPYQATELGAVRDFIQRGGTLALLLHVGPLNGHLLATLGVRVSNGVVLDPAYRLNKNGSDFGVRVDAAHPLLAGLEEVRFYGAWALDPGERNLGVLHASDSAWLDLNRNRERESHEPQAPFFLAVVGRLGAGKFVVFGDDAIFQNRFLAGDNAVLAQNLVRWLRP